jgi:release factor glutamine methyltransferase
VETDAFRLAGDGSIRAGTSAAPNPAGTFDLLVSNPPYIASDEVRTLQPEIREFEPALALDGGADGLSAFRALASHGAAWLRAGGKIMLEFGLGQEDALRTLFESEKWIVDEIVRDYSSHPRILIARPEAQGSAAKA